MPQRADQLLTLAAFLLIASARGESLVGEDADYDPTLFSGGDGTSCEKAVVIRHIKSASGVSAEGMWLRKNYPGAVPIQEGLSQWTSDHQSFELLTLRLPDGNKAYVCFEISSYFH